mgnify:CR=1 FL=1
MSRKSPRYAPPNTVIEITARTVGSQFLLRPSAELNAIILATMARALFLFPIKLHAFAFLSNHWHALLTALDGKTVSKFVQHVHSNVARAVNAMLDREGQVFRSASWVAVVVDSELDRLRYVLAQGAKEGLVASPTEWPGVHSVRALMGLEKLEGSWVDRTRGSRLKHGGGRGGGRTASIEELTTSYGIELTPLPSMAHLTEADRHASVRRLVKLIERSARRKTKRPLGVKKVLAQDPMSKPAKTNSYWPAYSERENSSRSHSFGNSMRIRFIFFFGEEQSPQPGYSLPESG